MNKYLIGEESDDYGKVAHDAQDDEGGVGEDQGVVGTQLQSE